ncbi:hypothetical protein JW948_01940 [bacterium]|nr:hypothetical protein [bacterium]
MSIPVYLTLVLAVFGRSSLSPLSLAALLSFIFPLKIMRIIMTENPDRKKMLRARQYAGFLHLTICMTIIVTSILTGTTGL